MVARIVLRFICFLACTPLVFEFLKFGFQRWDLALYLLSRFLFVLDVWRSALFFLVKELALPSALDVELISIIREILFLYVQYCRPIWVKLGEYCATCSLDTALWWFIATIVDVYEYLGGGGGLLYSRLLPPDHCQQVLGNCVWLVHIIRDLEWCFDLGQNWVLKFLE